jgi:hypothetical protein
MGLSAAKRAIPTNRGGGVGGAGSIAIDGMKHLRTEAIFAFYSPIVKCGVVFRMRDI